MKFADWLTQNSLTLTAAAALLEIDPTNVRRCARGQIPKPPLMRRIARVSGGAVTANDFYGDGNGSDPREGPAHHPGGPRQDVGGGQAALGHPVAKGGDSRNGAAAGQ